MKFRPSPWVQFGMVFLLFFLLPLWVAAVLLLGYVGVLWWFGKIGGP